MAKPLERIADLPLDTLVPVLHFVVQGLSHRIRLNAARAKLNGLSAAEYRLADAIFDQIERTEHTDIASLDPERVAKYTSDLSTIAMESSRKELKYSPADGRKTLRLLRSEPLSARPGTKGTKIRSTGRLRVAGRAARAK